ncbi:MAG: hypothetical protein DMG14_06640 [Acidobacteria bacterium]|nr:MAG: hypothetical protein DMG14_06640 [Acidobacteriota bacterium]
MSSRATLSLCNPAQSDTLPLSMDLHKLALERSLAYHAIIAAHLIDDPAILETARERVKGWLTEDPLRPFARKWQDILNRDANSIAAFLIDRSELAEELRQSSPFAGALDPRERWRVWRETRERLAGKS